MISILHVLIGLTLGANLSVDDRCKQMHARYQKKCQAADVLSSSTRSEGAVFSQMYSNCRGDLKDVSSATINITETPASTNAMGNVIPKMRQCLIEANSDKGTAVARYNQFGNSFQLEVGADGSVKTIITNSEGSVICSHGPKEAEYTSCSLKINGRTSAIPLKADFELGLVYMNQTPLISLSQPSITAPAQPAPTAP